MEYPKVSNEMVKELAPWVVKSYRNNKNFDKWLTWNLNDKSIGIHYGINKYIYMNFTLEDYKEICREATKQKYKQIMNFRKEMKIGDWIIIAQGKTKSLYLARIDSDYYYQELDGEEEFCRHRRKIKCIHKISDDFQRKSSMNTISKF